MLQKVLKKIFGTQNQRDLKRLQPAVAEINSREGDIRNLSDENLRGQTDTLRGRADRGEPLDSLLRRPSLHLTMPY